MSIVFFRFANHFDAKADIEYLLSGRVFDADSSPDSPGISLPLADLEAALRRSLISSGFEEGLVDSTVTSHDNQGMTKVTIEHRFSQTSNALRGRTFPSSFEWTAIPFSTVDHNGNVANVVILLQRPPKLVMDSISLSAHIHIQRSPDLSLSNSEREEATSAMRGRVARAVETALKQLQRDVRWHN